MQHNYSVLIRNFGTLAIAVALSTSAPIISFAENNVPAPVMHWYEALKSNDKIAFDQLLADTAVIELKDLGVSQTKKEFIEALDEWAEINGDAEIQTKPVAIGAGTIEMEVCYRFTSNEMMNREIFTLSNNKITGSIQEQLSDSCEDF